MLILILRFNVILVRLVTRIEKSIEIKAPPEKVFAFMLSEKMNDLWGKYMEAKWTTPGPVRVGTIGHWIAKPAFKLPGEWDTEVIEFEENKKMSMRTVESSKLKMTTTGILEPTIFGSKTTYIEEYEVPYSVIGKLADKITYRKATERFMDELLQNLKNALET